MTTAVADLCELLDTDPAVRVLDVRTTAEYQSSHIPGSYNVPLDTLREHARELAAVDHPVVLVCRSGARAGQAHEHLSDAGKAGLRVLDGGMVAWEAAGKEVVSDDSDHWALDRQVRLAAGTVAVAGLVASTIIPGAKWIAGGIGAGLVYSAVTDSCAISSLFERLPYNQAGDCDLDAVLADLRQER